MKRNAKIAAGLSVLAAAGVGLYALELAPDYDLVTVTVDPASLNPPGTMTCTMDYTGSTKLPSVSSCTVRSTTAYEFNGCSDNTPTASVFECVMDFEDTYIPTGQPYTEGTWEISAVSALDELGAEKMKKGKADLIGDTACVPAGCEFDLGFCTPDTCIGLSADCGTPPDGCGGNLSCGTCTPPETCGGGGTPYVCGCTPATDCNGGAWVCGSPPDGCGGVQSCGTCGVGEACSNDPNYTCEPTLLGTIHAGTGAQSDVLLDACDDPIRLVGVNHHGFIGSFPDGESNADLDGGSFAEIAKTGANVVKIAWGTPEAATNNADPTNFSHPHQSEQSAFTTGAFELTGTGSLNTQVQAAINAGLLPVIAMYDAVGPDNWGDPTDTTPNAETVTFTANTPPNVQITGTGLPALVVGDVFYIAAHATHNGLYKVVTVNTSTSDYIVKSISGATGTAATEAVNFHVPTGNFEHTIKWFESQAVREWVNGTDANGHNRSEYLIFNIAVESGPGTGEPYTEYIQAYEWAIKRLRLCNNPSTDPCFTIPLIIDADNWAADEASVSIASGSPTWLAADPLDNLIYGWHPYAALTEAQILAAMDTLEATGVPIFIGEYAAFQPWLITSYPTNCNNPADLTRVLSREAASRGFGLAPWAWGDDSVTSNHFWNNDFGLGCWELDMTNLETCASLERWGCDVVHNDPNGISSHGARSQYLIDRCGTEATRPAAGACGDTCASQSGFNCSDLTTQDYTTSGWASYDGGEDAATTLDFSVWVQPRDITAGDQGVWVGPDNGAGAPVTFTETSMRVNFTGGSTHTVAAVKGTGTVGVLDDDTFECDNGAGSTVCPTVPARQWHRVDFSANLTANTYDAWIVNTCSPMDARVKIAHNFPFATDSTAVNDPASLRYHGLWGSYRTCTGGTNDGGSCVTATQCPGGGCTTTTGTIRSKYPTWTASCEADCVGRECGDDGCGGSCGVCTGGEVCDDAGVCQPTGTLYVDVTSTPPTSGCATQNGWTLTGPTNLSGQGDYTFNNAPVGNYTLTWEDTEYACIPPAAEGPVSLGSGGTVTFDLSPANYTTRTVRQLGIDVQANGGACTDCPWQVAATGDWTSAEFFDSGTADESPLSGTGTVRDGRDYLVTWGTKSGYTTPSPSTVTLTAGATIQTGTGNWVEIAGTVFWSDTLQTQAAPSNFMEWISERPYDSGLRTNDYAGAQYGNTRITDPFGSGDWVAYGYANFTTLGGNRIELGVCGYGECQDTGGNSLPAFNAHLKSGNTTSSTAHAKFYISHDTYIPTQIYTQAGTQVNQWLSILDLHTCATSGTGWSCGSATWGGGWGWMALGDGGPGYDPGKLFMRPNNAPGTDSGLSTADYPAGQWFCLEFEVPVTQSAVGAIKTYINGSLILTKNNAQTFPSGGVPEDVGIYFKIYGDDQGSSDILPNPVKIYRKNFKISDYKTDCQ